VRLGISGQAAWSEGISVSSGEGADAGPNRGRPRLWCSQPLWREGALGGLVFRTALVFLVLSVLAAVLGSGTVSPASSVATLLFYVFLAGFAVALLLGLITGRRTAS
jgi:uncharacterized membrane protein YtjA (UPF0391 family)